MMNDLTSLAIAGLIAVSVLTGTYFYGKHVTQVEWDIANAKTEAEIEMLKEQAGRITTQTEIRYVDRVKIVKEKGDTIVQYIPQYITPEANASCIIPVGFTRVFNAAAKNELPGTPSETDGTSSGVTLTEVATTTATNFTTCYIYKARAEELMGWIREQKELNK